MDTLEQQLRHHEEASLAADRELQRVTQGVHLQNVKMKGALAGVLGVTVEEIERLGSDELSEMIARVKSRSTRNMDTNLVRDVVAC